MPKSRGKRMQNIFLLVAGALGIIVFWRGVWTLAGTTPVLENPWVSIVVGLVLLIASHQWYREL